MDSKRDAFAFLLGLIGGMGSVVGLVAWWDILEVVNRARPPDDQIPAVFATWNDFAKYWPLRHGPILKEFRRLAPQSRLVYWYFASYLWLAVFVIIAAFVAMSPR
jgi:hypothetical protein